MRDKNYWFGLRSYIYVDIKDNNMLLYDTTTGKYIETMYEKNIDLISQLYKSENLGFTLLSKEYQVDSCIHEFVTKVMDNEMGDLLDVDDTKNKPIRLIPILNLQRDIVKLKKTDDNYALIGQDMSHYLIELNIYINDNCARSCPLCGEYCKQIHSCISDLNCHELSIDILNNIFNQIYFFKPRKINILGGDIFNYTNLDKLSDLFFSNTENIYLYLNYKNYRMCDLLSYVNLEILVNFPIDDLLFEKVMSSINRNNAIFHFIVENEDQYSVSEVFIEKYMIDKYVIEPIFCGNIEFFIKNIFLNREDIFSKVIPMREIFRNQKMNANNFGVLYILPDGKVKANMNTVSLGNIQTDSLINLIYREMLDNTSWRTIRDINPCNKCLYQWICPPLSNYEYVINHPNLCNIGL